MKFVRQADTKLIYFSKIKPSSTLRHSLSTLLRDVTKLFSDARDKKVFCPCRRFPVPRLPYSCLYLSRKQPAQQTQDRHPSLSISLCLSFPPRPIPLFLLSSTVPSRRKPGLPENKHWSVERDKAEGGRNVRGSRGCFCRSSAPLVAPGLTVVHPEETGQPASRHSGQALGPHMLPVSGGMTQ